MKLLTLLLSLFILIGCSKEIPILPTPSNVTIDSISKRDSTITDTVPKDTAVVPKDTVYVIKHCTLSAYTSGNNWFEIQYNQAKLPSHIHLFVEAFDTQSYEFEYDITYRGNTAHMIGYTNWLTLGQDEQNHIDIHDTLPLDIEFNDSGYAINLVNENGNILPLSYSKPDRLSQMSNISFTYDDKGNITDAGAFHYTYDYSDTTQRNLFYGTILSSPSFNLLECLGFVPVKSYNPRLTMKYDDGYLNYEGDYENKYDMNNNLVSFVNIWSTKTNNRWVCE